MNKISTSTKGSALEHKRISEPVGFMLALLFAALTVYVASLAYSSIVNSNDYYAGTITVSGHGEIEMKNDVQKISIDIAPTATSSLDYAKKIIAYLKAKGVSDSDIRIPTSRLIIARLRGTNMTSSKTISSDIEKISSKYITPTLASPEVENPDQLRSRALQMALNNAKINAMKVSQSLGADLGKVISFYDNNGAGNDNFDPTLATSDISVTFQTR